MGASVDRHEARRAAHKNEPREQRRRGSLVSARKGIPFEARLFNVFTIVLFLTIAIQVFCRWVLNRSLSWTEEFSRYFFIWASYFAVSVGAYHGRHIRITFHIMLLPAGVRRIILAFTDLIWIGFNGLVVYNSVLFNLSMIEYPLYSATTRFNLVWVYLIIPFAYTLLTVRILQNMFARFRAETPEPNVEREY